MHFPRSLALLVPALVVATFLSSMAAATASPAQEPGRIIVLGMDGMDAAITADLMDRGLLPNFARLRAEGTFAPLMPGNPAQSPVSWATLNTGRNPGKHGIFDFLRISLNADDGLPQPSVGFQAPARVPVDQVGLPLASPMAPWLFVGGGLAAGIVLCFLLWRVVPLALLALIACGGTGAYLGFDLREAFPPLGFDDYRSLNQADEWWVELDRAGVPFRGQGTIVSYPVSALAHGELVAGLGAPDAKGSLNSWALYSTAAERKRTGRIYLPEAKPGDGVASSSRYVRLERAGAGRYTAKLYGPPNQTLKQRLEQRRTELDEQARGGGGGSDEFAEIDRRLQDYDEMNTWLPLSVAWQPGAATAEVTIGDQVQSIPLGHWSDWYRLEFAWNRWLSTRANARVWVESADDGELELYFAPLQIAPEAPVPGTRICWPPDFAGALASRIGDFETLGWACQTHAVKDAELSDAAFIADIEFTYTWRRKMLEDALAGGDWRVLFHFFGSPDRVCHMLMRHIDQLHPQYQEALANQPFEFFGEEVPAHQMEEAIYRRMDEAVGLVLERMRPDDTLLIVSDHGFDSFRREVNLNNWLVQEGFLAIDNQTDFGSARPASDFAGRKKNYLNWVDWTRTQAYSIAIGKIYLNRAGREGQGTVASAEVDAVLDRIVERLHAMTDPDTGQKVVKRVYRREEIYSGAVWQDGHGGNALGAPELTIDFYPGYRASWGVTSGGIDLIDVENADGELEAAPGPAITDNLKLWSGDHCGVDIESVQGIFFSNRKLALPDGDDRYDATHLGATVLDLMGVPVPADYDRRPLRRAE